MHLTFIRLPATSLVDPTLREPFGGAEVRAWTFARAIANHSSHHATLVVRRRNTATPSRVGDMRVAFVSDRRTSRDRGWSPKLLWQLPQDVSVKAWTSVQKRFAGEVGARRDFARLEGDVLATFELHAPTGAVIRSAHASGRPAILFLTSDQEVEFAMGEPAQESRARRRQLQYRDGIQTADLVIAQTALQYRLVELEARQVIQIRNPIDIDQSDSLPLPMRDRKSVIWIGRADVDCKRADLCIQVAKRCPQVPFTVVMNPTHTGTAVPSLADLPSNVRLLDYVPWNEMDTLIRRSLALLNTSDHEGFPNAFLQAGKLGVPVISRLVNPDESLTKGLGFFARGCCDTLVQMVRTIAAHPERFEAAGRAARGYVVRYHDSRARGQDLLAAAEEISQSRALPCHRNAS